MVKNVQNNLNIITARSLDLILNLFNYFIFSRFYNINIYTGFNTSNAPGLTTYYSDYHLHNDIYLLRPIIPNAVPALHSNRIVFETTPLFFLKILTLCNKKKIKSVFN